MSQSPHSVSWFEVPATNFSRSKAFYEAVLGLPIEPVVMGPITMGFLSTDPNAVGGVIVSGGEVTPSAHGTTVYLDGGEDLASMLARVEKAGGSIVIPKTGIGNDFGFFALFIDTAGNKGGLHSTGCAVVRLAGWWHCRSRIRQRSSRSWVVLFGRFDSKGSCRDRGRPLLPPRPVPTSPSSIRFSPARSIHP